MKIYYYPLKNRGVIYIKEDIEYKLNKAVGNATLKIINNEENNLLRVENINGHIHVSLLPTNFKSENGAEIVKVTPHASIQIVAAGSCSQFVVKQGRHGSELGIQLFDKSINCKALSNDEFYDYVSTIASSNTYETNAMNFMMELYNETLNLVSQLPIKIDPQDSNNYDPYNAQLLTQFNYLAEERQKALEQENVNE